MTLTDLAILAERINALHVERIATEAAVQEAFGDDDSAAIADETPELIKAAA